MISLGSQLWESVRRRADSNALNDDDDPGFLSYRSLFEQAQAQRREPAREGRGEPVVLCSDSALERAAAMLAAAADGLPFFVAGAGVMSEEEARALLPWPKALDNAWAAQEPNAAFPRKTDQHAPPFCYLLEPCPSPPLCVRGMERHAADEGIKSRISRLSITAESRVLSLLDPLSPGYPYVLCSCLLAGAQWVDASDEQSAALEALLDGAVTHVEGPPDRVEELLSLCAASDLAALRYVVLHGPAPDAPCYRFARESLPAARCLRSTACSRGERIEELTLPDAPQSEPSLWLHGCEISPAAYAVWMEGYPGVREALVIQSEGGYLECFLDLDGAWDPDAVGSRLECLPSFARPRAFYSASGVQRPLSLQSPAALREHSALLPAPGRAGTGDPVLRDVMRIWADVLKMEVAPEDSFTRLGGTSYQMTQVFLRIKETFPVEIHIVDLYKNIRANALADFLKAQMQRQGTYQDYCAKELDAV